MLRLLFDRKCSAISNNYGLMVSSDEIGFSGIRTIYLKKLTIIPNRKDTLLLINDLRVKLGIDALFSFKANPLEVWMNSAKVNLVGNKQTCNYLDLFQNNCGSTTKPNESKLVEDEQSDSHIAVYRILKAIFGLTTADYHVKDFTVTYKDTADNTQIYVNRFESNKNGFDTRIVSVENGNENILDVTGLASRKESSLRLKASMSQRGSNLPLLFHKFGINISFDTLEIRLQALKLNQNEIQLELKSSVRALGLYSQRLSEENVLITKGELHLDLNIAPDSYTIDSTSSFSLNGLKANLYVNYLPRRSKYLAFIVKANEFPSQNLFDALPEGLFSNIRGIKSSGNIEFSLKFGAKLTNPDSIILDPIFNTKEFSLKQYGYTNFTALNDTFSHSIYEEGQFIRTIHLGAKNKDFRSLQKISPFIVDAIVTSEDGGFFGNSGFDLEAFKYAISENIKQKRFARGGSTITQQLVKNLYLSKSKNLFRKAEEYLIVWLMGSQGVVSKERLMEIYLNIIEWGPNVYGVTEACRYYFDKDPANVTLDEAIYLATVIPRPKKFKYLFEKDGNLKPFMENDFTFISSKMLQRGMLTDEQINQLKYNVTLQGKAKDMLRDTTYTTTDSLIIDEISLAKDTTLLLL